MESIFQSLTIAVISLSILLFFGPILVITSVIGFISIGPLTIDLRRKKKIVRVSIAIIGVITWFLLYAPLVFLSYKAISEQTPEQIPTNVANTSDSLPTITPQTIISQTNEPTPTTLPITPTNSKATSTQTALPSVEYYVAKVSSGDFYMGSDMNFPHDYNPSHSVYIDEFFIDLFEVTNHNYSLCVEAQYCSPPTELSSSTRKNYFYNPDYGSFPVIYVDWEMARSYCEWVDGRLPTEAEWEKAARFNPSNPSGNLYPWGSSNPLPAFVNYYSEDTVEVGSLKSGQSYFGVSEMAGNVFEWVSDFYSSNYYSSSPIRNPIGPNKSMDGHVVRGGSWSTKEDKFLWTYRRFFFSPETTRNDLGFRCVYDKNPTK